MDRKDKHVLMHMQAYCNDIVESINRFGDNYNTFINDTAYFHSVSMCILQIGELTKSLSDDFRNQTINKIPWRQIIGMRNWLVHGYMEIDENTIWETAKHDIPNLLEFCTKTLQQTNKILLDKSKPLFQENNNSNLDKERYDIDY